MRSRRMILGGLVMVIAAIVYVAITAWLPGYRDIRAFRSAEQAEKVAGDNYEAAMTGYQDYLSAHPRGRHAEAAAARTGDLAWRLAERMNTEEAYASFSREYPGHERAIGARQKWADLAWYRAQSTQSPEAYETFASDFPQDPRAAQAGRLADAPVRYDYSGSWSRFVEAALPASVKPFVGGTESDSRRRVTGIVVVDLESVLQDAGRLPKDYSSLALGWVGREGRAPELVRIAPIPVPGRSQWCFIMPDSKPGRYLLAKVKLEPSAERQVEFVERGSKVTAIAYNRASAPPSNTYAPAAVYLRSSDYRMGRYFYALGTTLGMAFREMGLPEEFYPRAFIPSRIPNEILGTLERRSIIAPD